MQAGTRVRWPQASAFECTDLPQMAKSGNSLINHFFMAQDKESAKIIDVSVSSLSEETW